MFRNYISPPSFPPSLPPLSPHSLPPSLPLSLPSLSPSARPRGSKDKCMFLLYLKAVSVLNNNTSDDGCPSHISFTTKVHTKSELYVGPKLTFYMKQRCSCMCTSLPYTLKLLTGRQSVLLLPDQRCFSFVFFPLF